MSLLLFKPFQLFHPDPVSGISVPPVTGETSREDMVDFLSEEDDKEVIELEDKSKNKGKKTEEPESKPDSKTVDVSDDSESEETDEDVDELSEIEDELKEPTEEQLELIAPVRRREILKKYPNLFKDFPYLEKAYYREQQFTELLPTIEDARQAVQKSEVLDRFEADVIQGGNLSNILKAVKEENPDAFLKIADSYLPVLAEVDQAAYMHVLGNVSKHTIIAMVQEAQRSNNEPLRLAAQILNQFIFGSSEFSPPTQLAKGDDSKKPDAVKEREQAFVKKQFDNTLSDLNTRVNNTLRNTIEANIDPRQSMTDYVRKNASRDALDQLNTLINQDMRFRGLVDKLWEKAFEEDFSRESVERIKSAHLAKAKSLLPTVIKKARNEALRGMGKRARDDDETNDTSTRKGPVTTGRPRSQTSSGNAPKGKVSIPAGMSTLDFLNSE